MDLEPVRPLRPGRDFLPRARTILAGERARLAGLLGGPGPDLALVGGSSLPDTLTQGDVDLHLRVPAVLPTGVAVTPAGWEHDVRFRRCWQRLAAEPGLVAAHNAMKLAARDDPARYERRKSAFFDRLTEPHPAG